jgi:hypothetical protein
MGNDASRRNSCTVLYPGVIHQGGGGHLCELSFLMRVSMWQYTLHVPVIIVYVYLPPYLKVKALKMN